MSANLPYHPNKGKVLNEHVIRLMTYDWDTGPDHRSDAWVHSPCHRGEWSGYIIPDATPRDWKHDTWPDSRHECQISYRHRLKVETSMGRTRCLTKRQHQSHRLVIPRMGKTKMEAKSEMDGWPHSPRWDLHGRDCVATGWRNPRRGSSVGKYYNPSF